MLTIYDARGNGLAKQSGAASISETSVWIDLFDPTPEEDRFVEKALGISIPTRAEMREIEASNRLYHEQGAYFMTAVFLYNIDSPQPEYSPVTFILGGNRLVTVRYADFKAVPMFLGRCEKGDANGLSGPGILAGLLESFVQRKADLIERIQDEVDRLAHSIFDLRGGQQTRSRRLDAVLRTIGKQGDITSRAQESAASVDRLLLFLAQAARERKDDETFVRRVETLHRDVKSLIDHLLFLTNRTTFLLNATLGAIANEQNQIIKLFSVMAVILMPPTVIGTIYGMNFTHMPELKWLWGYPFALGFMVVSAVVPYLYFRRKGWL